MSYGNETRYIYVSFYVDSDSAIGIWLSAVVMEIFLKNHFLGGTPFRPPRTQGLYVYMLLKKIGVTSHHLILKINKNQGCVMPCFMEIIKNELSRFCKCFTIWCTFYIQRMYMDLHNRPYLPVNVSFYGGTCKIHVSLSNSIL